MCSGGAFIKNKIFDHVLQKVQLHTSLEKSVCKLRKAKQLSIKRTVFENIETELLTPGGKKKLFFLVLHRII